MSSWVIIYANSQLNKSNPNYLRRLEYKGIREEKIFFDDSFLYLKVLKELIVSITKKYCFIDVYIVFTIYYSHFKKHSFFCKLIFKLNRFLIVLIELIQASYILNIISGLNTHNQTLHIIFVVNYSIIKQGIIYS